MSLLNKSATAWRLGIDQPGAAQTVSVVSPYIYAEDNWTDDMELAAAQQYDVLKDFKPVYLLPFPYFII